MTHPYDPDGWLCKVSPGKSGRPRLSLPAGALEELGGQVGEKLSVEVEDGKIIVTIQECRDCGKELTEGYHCDACDGVDWGNE